MPIKEVANLAGATFRAEKSMRHKIRIFLPITAAIAICWQLSPFLRPAPRISSLETSPSTKPVQLNGVVSPPSIDEIKRESGARESIAIDSLTSRKNLLISPSVESPLFSLPPTRSTGGRPVEFTGESDYIEAEGIEIDPSSGRAKWKGKSFTQMPISASSKLMPGDFSIWVEDGFTAIWGRGSDQPAYSFLGEVSVREPLNDFLVSERQIPKLERLSWKDNRLGIPPCLLFRTGAGNSPRIALSAPGYSPLTRSIERGSPGIIATLSPAGDLDVVIFAYRPSPRLTFSLHSLDSRAVKLDLDLADILPPNGTYVRFRELPIGNFSISIIDKSGPTDFIVESTTCTVKRNGVCKVSIDLLMSESDSTVLGFLDLSLDLGLPIELFNAQLGRPSLVEISPINIRLAQIGLFKKIALPLNRFEGNSAKSNIYRKQFDNKLPVGRYSVSLSTLGRIGTISIANEGINAHIVECPKLHEWKITLTGELAGSVGDFAWTASLFEGTDAKQGEYPSGARIPCALVRSSPRAMHLYATPGIVRLRGIGMGGRLGSIRKQFAITLDVREVELEVARNPGCTIKLYEDGVPLLIELDRWPRITIKDVESKNKLLESRPVKYDPSFGTAEAVAISSETGGEATLVLEFDNPSRRIECEVELSSSFLEYRIDT